MEINIYTDGGSRGNPGPCGAGGVIFGSDGTIISEISKYLGIGTNNYAEYMALILTLERVSELGISDSIITVFMDSQLIIKHINGTYKVKHPNMKKLYNEVKELITEFENIKFVHIPRNKNTHADSLANKAMDSVKIT